MFTELQEIKHVRKKLGLTQAKLAKHANVSQSLIAKIEAGSLDPTYTNAQKIFAALQSFTQKHEKKAGMFMKKNLVYLETDDTIKTAIQKMKKYSISQLPVLEQKKAVGLVSETALLDALMKNISPHSPINEIMDEAPPTIDPQASIQIVSQLLKYYPLILVAEKGKLLGIITKSDMLESAYT
jgi:predicted transcriptional regulator